MGKSRPSTSRQPGCSALWCNRRLKKSIRVPSLFSGCTTKKKIIAKRKAARNTVLKQLYRHDVVRSETNAHLQSDKGVRVLRYCVEHTTVKDGKRIIRDLKDDPVFNGTIEGVRKQSLSQIQGTRVERERNRLATTKEVDDRSARILARDATKQRHYQKDNFKARFSKGLAGTTEENALLEIENLQRKIVKLQNEVAHLTKYSSRLSEKLKQQQNHHLTYESLVGSTLRDSCSSFVLLPADGLQCFVKSMEIVELHHIWNEEVSKIPCAKKLGFRNAVVLCLLRCRWATSETLTAWIMGLGVKNRRQISRIFRITLLLINQHLAHTVALPPDVSQVDKDALPAFQHPDLDNVMMTVDATNIRIQTPHNPYGQKATYSDYYGDNCVKCEIISSNAGLPMFVSPAFGGRASEADILEQSGFASFYKSVEANCVDESGTPFKPAVLADKGTRIKAMVDELGGQYITPSMIVDGETSRQDIIKNEIISKARGHVERCIGCAKRNRILTTDLPHALVYLIDEIIYFCFFVTHFIPRKNQ